MTQATVTVERPVNKRPLLRGTTIEKLAKVMKLLNATNEQDAIDLALTQLIDKSKDKSGK